MSCLGSVAPAGAVSRTHTDRSAVGYHRSLVEYWVEFGSGFGVRDPSVLADSRLPGNSVVRLLRF